MKPVFFLTGATRGVGRAIAERLAPHFRLALLARSPESLAGLIADLGLAPEACLPLPSDLATIHGGEQARDLIARIITHFGRLDGMIHNAGIGSFASLDAMSAKSLTDMVAINLTAPALLTQAGLSVMKAQGSGQCVLIASDAAYKSFPGGTAYCASKTGIVALYRSLRKEVHQHGIRVNIIAPGLIATEFNGRAIGGEDPNYWLSPHDVAGAVEFVVRQPPTVVVDELILHPMRTFD